MQRGFKPSALIIILFCQKGNKEGKVLSQHSRISFWPCENIRSDLKGKTLGGNLLTIQMVESVSVERADVSLW